MHTHGSLLALTSSHPGFEAPIDDSNLICDIAGFSFIVSVYFTFFPLLTGAGVFITSEDTRKDIRSLYELFCKKHVTIVSAVAKMAVMLLTEYDMRPFTVITGGEKLPSFKPLYPSNIIQCYGTSEGCFPVYGKINGPEQPMPLGRANKDILFDLLDDEGQPVPPGEVGELVYSGSIMAKGYLNHPELTKEKWVEKEGRRWFHTGDLMRMDEDGTLYYVQRKDFLIKLRGFRIEPGEVENCAIHSSGGQITTAVCVLKKIDGEDYLCLYYEAENKVDEQLIRAGLSKSLPDYMMPDLFIHMDRLPRNTNGKLDRLNLPDPETNGKRLSSLALMRIAAEAYDEYGIILEFEELFQAGNKEAIRALIEEKKSRGEKTVKEALPQVEAAPLGFSQAGVYVDCITNPKSLAYNLPMLLTLPDSVSEDMLENALIMVLDAHPGINVCFETAPDGSRLQRLCKNIPANRGIIRKKISEAELCEYKKTAVRPFELESDKPLYRLEIIRTEEKLCLFSDFHHLIFDGSSYDLFYAELFHALNGEELRKEHFSALQLAAEQSKGNNDQSMAYWRERISMVSSISEIPDDLYNDSHEAGMERSVTETVNADRVRAFAQKIHVSSNAVYLAAFLLVVSAYTAEDVVSIATVSSGRKDLRIANSFGMFVNTLPVITSISAERTVDFVKEIQKVLLGAIEHENCSFSEIASEFDFKPGILFAGQEGLLEQDVFEKSGAYVEDLANGTAKFPLYMAVMDEQKNVRLELRYDENLYSEEMMKQLCRTTAHVLEQLVKKEELSLISYCDESQLKLLDSFNTNKTPSLETETIVSMFRNAVRAFPDRHAVVFKDTALTYRELDEETDRLAKFIETRAGTTNGSMHEPVVSILTHRGMNMVVCALAALKAGCAYQPLDPGYPAKRIGYMIKDAQPVLLIADESCLSLASSYEGEVLKTDEITGLPVSQESLRADIAPDHLFILLYTSGSTGKPKGVMLEHQNLTAFCRWYRQNYDLRPEHKVAAYASFGFDACMMDLYPALTTGACVYIIPEEMRLDLNAINAYFEENGITHAFMTTQVGVQFHQTQKNHSLKHLSVGGEKLVSVKPGEHYLFHNGYGPTECTIFSTEMPVLKQEPNTPIGRPTSMLKCYVVDKKLRRLPAGAYGELIIVGAQVGRGYLNLPEKSAEVFFDWNGERAYRTGDIVRYRMNGDIEYAGRKDDQVKIRGFRIELKEIETVIREVDGVRDVTVQAFDSPQGGKFLAAYIVCDETLSMDEIRSHILKSKPSYMLPASIMRIPAIPLNINNKVNRHALPDPSFTTNKEYVAPETDKERITAEAARRALGIREEVSVLDGFSELGGDSINALRFTTELAKSGLEILPNQILRLDTIREIAKAAVFVSKQSNEKMKNFTGSIENTAIVQYFFDLGMPVPSHFNQAMLYRTDSPVDMHLLSQSFDALVRHHDMLRAVIQNGSLFVRELAEETYYSLTEDTADELERKADALQRGFDLENGPLMRACVFHDRQFDYLLIVIHHLIVDGVSWRILTEDLNTAYTALASKEEVSLRAATDTYADYADALKKYRQSPALISQKPYWEHIHSRLEDLPSSDRSKSLPVFERIDLRIDKELTQELLTNAGISGFSRIDTLFLAALGISYYDLTGETSLSVRLEGHGREIFDPYLNISRTIGWFTSIYPVVLENLDHKLPAVIRETKDSLRRIPMNSFGHGILYGIETQRMPLMTFNYLGRMSDDSDGFFKLSEDHGTGELVAPENCYGTDLNVNGLSIDGSITFMLDYNSLRYTRDQMQEFAYGFMSVLKKIAKYVRSLKAADLTAGDFGEREWKNAEFEFIVQDYAERGESIHGIYPMSRTMMRSFKRALLSMDDHPEMIRIPVQLCGFLTHEMFYSALTELYDHYEDLRYSIAFYGVSKPRLVLTDRKPEMTYSDVSDEKDPYLKMKEDQYSQFWSFIDLQMHSLMQLGVWKTAENEHYLFFSFHKILFDMTLVRDHLEEYLRLLEFKTAGDTNIPEWMDMFRVGTIRALTPSKKADPGLCGSEMRPMSENEQKVAGIFETLLNIDSKKLTSESDFFDVGGDKFMCVELSDMIFDIFKRTVSPVLLCENPTIRQIAEMIEAANEAEIYEDIHVYSNHPDKRNLFFVHTANTGSEAYYKLAKYLENDFSFAVVEQYNINHVHNPKEDIPSLATMYIEIIKRIQPDGPYYLGGWCLGGTVAYEMARQLTLAGESVDKLIMLDSHIIESKELQKKILKSSGAHFREYLSTAPLFEGIRKKGLLERYLENAGRAARMALEYDPPEYDGSVLYFKAGIKADDLTDTLSEMYNIILKEKAAGFEKKVPEDKLKIIEVKTDHDSMMNDDALQVIVPAIIDYLK
jgi:amino acid adenylation domain-containing protein/non-ribosomal peptide synthase protein (TIGR01720 family)